MWLWKQDLNWPMTSAILVQCSTNWANKPPTSQIWSRLKITFILMSLSTVQIYGFQIFTVIVIISNNNRHPSHINRAKAKEDVMTIIIKKYDDFLCYNDIDNIWHSTNLLDWDQRLIVHLQSFLLPHPPPPMNHFQSHPCLCHLIQRDRLQIDQNQKLFFNM